jgi:hypothetical protein
MLAGGVEAGCILGSERGEACMGIRFGLLLTALWFTPIWVASMALGFFLKLISSRR